MNELDEVNVEELLKPHRSSFVMRVKGASMLDIGIRKNDYVIVEARGWAANGEIVVAVVDGAAVLRRYSKSATGVRLETQKPEHQDGRAIDRPEAEVQIRGVVVGVLRKY